MLNDLIQPISGVKIDLYFLQVAAFCFQLFSFQFNDGGNVLFKAFDYIGDLTHRGLIILQQCS